MLDIRACTRVHVKNEKTDRAASNQPVATTEQLGANVIVSVYSCEFFNNLDDIVDSCVTLHSTSIVHLRFTPADTAVTARSINSNWNAINTTGCAKTDYFQKFVTSVVPVGDDSEGVPHTKLFKTVGFLGQLACWVTLEIDHV